MSNRKRRLSNKALLYTHADSFAVKTFSNDPKAYKYLTKSWKHSSGKEFIAILNQNGFNCKTKLSLWVFVVFVWKILLTS